MGSEPAKFVRFVMPVEEQSRLVLEAKAYTFENYCEVAVVRLESGRMAMVAGGRFGIDLARKPGVPSDTLWVTIEGVEQRVTELIFHTHPIATGPSDGDFQVLELLNQPWSQLFELFGGGRGTVFSRKPKGQP